MLLFTFILVGLAEDLQRSSLSSSNQGLPSQSSPAPSTPPPQAKRCRKSNEPSQNQRKNFAPSAPLSSCTQDHQTQRAVAPIPRAATNVPPEERQAISEELQGFVDSTMQTANETINEFVDTVARMPPADEDVEMADETANVNKRGRDYAFDAEPEADNAANGKIVISVLKLHYNDDIYLTSLSLTIDHRLS